MNLLNFINLEEKTYGQFQRRDFRFDILTHSSAFSADDSLFAHLGKHEIFTPTKAYPTITVKDLAAARLVRKESV